MNKKKKTIRVKPTQSDINKKIKKDALRRFSYFVESDASVEFIAPEENSMNRSLMVDIPIVNLTPEGKFTKEGVVGKLKYFYLPKSEYQNLISIFQEFEIPKIYYGDLTYAFLSMVFAACNLSYIIQFQKEQHEKSNEFVEVMELLEEFSLYNKSLEGLTLEYKGLKENEKKERIAYGPIVTKKYKGHIAMKILESILQNYKTCTEYERAKISYGFLKNGFSKSLYLMGYKNEEQKSQAYYANTLWDYLRKHLFQPAIEMYVTENENWKQTFIELRTKYSYNNRYLLIGRMMILAQLLTMKKDDSDKAVTDLIKKKLRNKIKYEKQQAKNNLDEAY